MNRRPNVVVVHWHDLGTYLPIYGHAVCSPCVERLASDSVVLTRAFSTSPLCSPARGALWTGRYPHSNGLQGLTHRGWEYDDGERTLPMLLADAGYRTALVGLQHESRDPARTGFAEIVPVADQHAGTVAAAASAWLTEHADDDAPFLLTCGTFEVHRDWPADRYGDGEVAPDDVDVPPYLPDNAFTRRDVAAFGASIAVADRALGEILDALARTGLDGETIVVFTTDHGAPFPGAKSTLYDPGVQVALVVRLPEGVGSGARREDGLISHVDLVPTLLDLLDLPVPATVQGTSAAAMLRDGAPSPRTEVFLEKTYHADYDPIRAIRTETHKYVRSFEPRPLLDLPPDLEGSETRRGMGDAHLAPRPPEELYDLRTDPGERTNLADDPAHRAVRDELRDRLERFMVDTDDALLHGPIPPPTRVAVG